MTELVPPAESGEQALVEEREQPWLRLDKRMLLVHPLHEVVRLAPVLLVSLVIGTRSDNHIWTLAGLVLVVGFALLRWFTTTYRIGPVHVELRTGVFEKKRLSVPRTRIRSVDAEAGLLHRMLGLSVVRIGTGRQAERDEGKFELNALDASLVPGLRAALLTERPTEATAAELTPSHPSAEIAHFSPTWVRYAPFSLTGVVTIAAAVGVAFQYGLGERIARSSIVTEGVDAATSFGIIAAIAGGIVGLLVVASVLACVRYLLTYGGLTVLDDGRVLHVGHGLLKTRQTSLDRARLRGTTMHEPLLLRLAGGARLDAIMTGVAAEARESSLLLPQAPAAEARRVMNTVIGDAAPAEVALAGHGPIARRRRYFRSLAPVALVAVALAVVGLFRAVPWFVWPVLAVVAVAAVALGWDRARGLGHAVLPGWLITQNGSLDRTRDSIQAGGIIGWTVRQSFFQRRAGVATVVAATPAGRGRYIVLDVPVETAWQLVESVTPGAGDIWIREH